MGPYTRETIDNWVGDFCNGDAVLSFSAGVRQCAVQLLSSFLVGACEVRDVEPAELEEPDLKPALLALARQSLPDDVHAHVPALCGAFLAELEVQGRLGGGRLMGAYVRALKTAYIQAASGKAKPIKNVGSQIGRNDPCPCGSGRKYKKCCASK